MDDHNAAGEAVRQRSRRVVTTVKIGAKTMPYYEALRKYGEKSGCSYNGLMNQALIDYAKLHAGCYLAL